MLSIAIYVGFVMTVINILPTDKSGGS